MVQSQIKKKNALHDLGYKIFLDRYALKDMKRETLAVGDLVIVVVNSATGQREVGRITAMQLPQVTIELLDGEIVTRDIEHVDKPLETDPAQMMDRVAKGIAAVEKTTKKRREWADKFRWLLEDWKFVPGGRILTAAGTDQELTFYNCMPPEQEILTADGYKPIADVRVGDLVVTHQNRLRPVLHKFERETEEDIYTITTKKIGYDVLRVTGEHKIHVIRSEWVNNGHLVAGQTSDWIPANQLNTGDFVSVAYNGEVCPPDPIYVRDYLPQYDQILELDADLCYLFGAWLANGHLISQPLIQSDVITGIEFAFKFDKPHRKADIVSSIIKDKFGVKVIYQESVLNSESTLETHLESTSKLLVELFIKFLGGSPDDKHIPNQLMHLDDKYIYALLNGLLSDISRLECEKFIVSLPNRRLAIQAHQLLLRLGFFLEISCDGDKFILTALKTQEIEKFYFGMASSKPTIEPSDEYFEYDGLRWVRIDSITTENYRGIVMDIEVEEDHSFVSAGLVVSNCYVIPMIGDSRGGIIETLGNMTEIMSRGGGVGINLSTLRPRHAYVKGVNGRSSGSVSWGALYSFVTGLIEQGGSRRGALMLILNDWHPDIFDFVNSKREAGKITNANISVGISDRFMDAMKADGDWHLQFPDTSHPDYDTLWDGDLEKWMASGRPVITYKTIKAKELWNAVIESAWASAEPGVWFRERSNKMSNSWYFNPLIATNPCGEQPLSAYSVCNLGAINLAKFYDEEKHDVAWDDLERTVAYAVRFLDNVIDTTPYFFEENRKVQLSERRVGLGTMGVAELMIKLHIRYGSDESVEFIDKLYKFMAIHAYKTSSAIAKEKGAFPQFDPEKFLQSGFMVDMPADVREQIRKDGIRNVTLLTQAPTGTTGTMVNTSTGIEPFFSWVYYRKSRLGLHEEKVPIVQQWYAENPHADELPDYFVTAMDLTPIEHVKVQGAFQKWIDSAISKTANLPNNYTVQQTAELYEYMYALGCKGGTIYRDGSRDEQVLMLKGDERAEKENEAKSKKEDKVEQVATPHRVYPRPKKLHGVTVNTQTPFGTAYITMNSDEQGYPFEVFITAPGKAGSDLQADAEGLGRMISLSLRTTEPHNRREMLRLIIDQLRDIGGARSIGFGIERVISLPDAVARALEDHYFPKSETLQLQIPMMDVGISKSSSQPKLLSSNGHDHHHDIELNYSTADLCPACGTISLVRAEGCRRCLTCDYTEC